MLFFWIRFSRTTFISFDSFTHSNVFSRALLDLRLSAKLGMPANHRQPDLNVLDRGELARFLIDAGKENSTLFGNNVR
ncbi:MAG: hypothetical protein ABFS17_14535 [Chloroflexota bacterium]